MSSENTQEASVEEVTSVESSRPRFSLFSVLEAAQAPPEIEEDGVLTNKKLEEMVEDIGMIYTSFPENPNPEFEGRTHFPKSYHTLSPKEKLMLLFAENFRRQFKVRYPDRKGLLLAPKNECGVQVSDDEMKVSFSSRQQSFLIFFTEIRQHHNSPDSVPESCNGG